MDEREILDLARESNALLEGHFQLSSGLHSDRFFQCALVLMYPDRAARLAQELSARLADETVDVVVGPALGAMTWAYEVGRALGVRALFTERREGVMGLRRGFQLEPGERVLVVEDVLTTGGSVKETIRVVREHGGNPVRVGAIFNRTGGNPFEDLGLPLTALADVKANAWEAPLCPLCAAGDPVAKPGSRPGGAVKGAAI